MRCGQRPLFVLQRVCTSGRPLKPSRQAHGQRQESTWHRTTAACNLHDAIWKLRMLPLRKSRAGPPIRLKRDCDGVLALTLDQVPSCRQPIVAHPRRLATHAEARHRHSGKRTCRRVAGSGPGPAIRRRQAGHCSTCRRAGPDRDIAESRACLTGTVTLDPLTEKPRSLNRYVSAPRRTAAVCPLQGLALGRQRGHRPLPK